MISVSDEFKEAWLQGHQKYIQLDFSDGTSLADGDIVGESFRLEQTLCSEEQIVFGLTSSAKLTVQVYNAGKRYSGLSVTPTLAAFEGGRYHMMRMGTYRIAEDRRSDDRNYRTITAYDALYDVVGADYSEWYNQLYIDNGGKCTLKAFRDAFFSHVGIGQEDAELANDSAMTVGRNNVETFSGADIIRCICEPNAAFGFLNYEGRFQYVAVAENAPLFPDPDLYPSPDIYPTGGTYERIGSETDANGRPSSIVYEDFYTHEVTQAKWPETDRNADVVVGTEGNCYEFGDNNLFYEATEDVLRGIASNFVAMQSYFWYVPSKVKMRARPWVQPGDLVAVSDGKDSVFFPVLNRAFSGVTATYDEFEAKGTEWFAYSANSMGRTIADFEHYNGTTEVRLTKNEEDITAEVRARKDADTELSSVVKQTAEGLTVEINKRTTSAQVQTLIEASADSIRLKTGTLIWQANNSSLTKEGLLTANNMKATGGTFTNITANGGTFNSITAPDGYFENVTLGNSVYFALNGRNNRYMRLQASSDNTLHYYKANGTDMGKIHCGAIETNRVDTDGVTIDMPDGNIDADGKITAYRVNCDYMRAETAKKRAVRTSYGKCALYCYETPAPLFGDVGRGVIDGTGVCVVAMDDVFFETVVPDVEYDAFIQPYGKGECYVSERRPQYFIVEGTPGLGFAWEVKMAQSGLDTTRLEDEGDGSVMDEFPSEGLPRYDSELLEGIDYEGDDADDLLDELLQEVWT